MKKVCDLIGVRQLDDDCPIEVCINDAGRLILVVSAEAGCVANEVDLVDLIEQLRLSPCRSVLVT